MRQTSQAVLLLISSAAAANPAVNFPLALNTNAVTARTIVTQGSIAPTYTGKPVYGFTILPAVTNGTNKAVRIAAMAVGVQTGATGVFATTKPGTSCVGCMQNRASASTGAVLGVWCSAAWNYEYTALSAAGTYPTAEATTTPTASGLVYDTLGSYDGTTAADRHKGDQGACCYSQADWTAVSANSATQATAGTTKQDLFNKFMCPAKFTNVWTATGATKKIDPDLGMATTNWWCSDGSYNLKADALYGTAGATASGLKAVIADFAAASGNAATSEIVPLDDKRLELFMAACRQKKINCGGSSMIPETGTMSRVVLATSGMTSLEKCTWTMMSLTKAPSFKISGGSVALTANWDVMYQEWVDGWQVSKLVDFMPMITSATAADVRTMNGVIYPHLLGAVYAKAAKYNYPSITSGNVEDAISANGQRSGMAYTLVNPTAKTCTLAASDVQSPANCVEAFKARWFTASDANGGTKGAGANMATFTGKLGTFNTAATAYNTYLADLKTANEKDAFAAFFAPPTKPAFVKRPATPWVPAAYTGLQHWTAQHQQDFWDRKASSAPLANEYVLGSMPSASANSGGWGNWTIQRFNAGAELMNANFIWHSFGMLGTTAAPTNNMTPYIKNWNQDTEDNLGGGTTFANFRLSSGTAGSVMCATADGTAVTDKCLMLDVANAGTKTIANTKNVYLSVSLWANKASWETDYVTANDVFPAAGFTILFAASTWGDATDYYAPAAAGTPTTLTEPAAAQALAASAAAVLAVAAALY